MRRLLVLALLLLGLSGLAQGENFAGTNKSGQPSPTTSTVANGDFPDAQTAAFRSAIAVADTRTTAGILATTEFVLNGRQGILLNARFSASGATASVRVVYVHKTTVPGSSTDTTINKIKGYSDVRTLTAGTSQYEGAYYTPDAGDEFFDGMGAIAIRVIVTTAPSSGTVTFWVGSK
jgi:hypothetical protein